MFFTITTINAISVTDLVFRHHHFFSFPLLVRRAKSNIKQKSAGLRFLLNSRYRCYVFCCPAFELRSKVYHFLVALCATFENFFIFFISLSISTSAGIFIISNIACKAVLSTSRDLSVSVMHTQLSYSFPSGGRILYKRIPEFKHSQFFAFSLLTRHSLCKGLEYIIADLCSGKYVSSSIPICLSLPMSTSSPANVA